MDTCNTQLCLFSETDNIALVGNKILSTAQSALLPSKIPINSVSLVRGQSNDGKPLDSYSLKLLSMFLMRITFPKKLFLHIEIKINCYNELLIPPFAKVRQIASKKDFVLIDFPEENEEVYDFITKIVNYGCTHYVPEEYFGCCDLYVQCSDMKKCLYPNQLYAKACKYRRNLESGRIFYGKNKNI